MSRIAVQTGRIFLWLSVTTLALWGFIDVTRDFLEGDTNEVDHAIMLVVAKIRVPWLTAIAVDVTALGSITLVTLFAALMFVVLLALRNRIGALQLAIASIGAAFWTEVTKNIIERARPEVIPRLVEVSGSSYPSGHSLAATSTYFTIAILVGHRLESAPARIAILAMAGLMIVLVAFSRVYLGVHYPTDVAGGVALGGAWGFFVAGTFSLIGHRRDR